MAIFGFSFAFPFLSIFLNKDLGVRTGTELYLWTAASASASGIAMAVASPIWGILGDRYGRKPMLIRSMLGGAITVGIIYFAQNPAELVVLRLLQGATSGTVAAATALVAAETPRSRVGWALGVVTSAVALGSAIGPVVGGLAAEFLGLRLVFLGGGVLLALSLIPVLAIVRESPLPPRVGPRVSTLALLNEQPGLRHALTVLIGAQGLVSVCTSATQQLVVLRLLEMITTGVSAVSGLGFGLAGLASSVAAVGYTRVTRRLGYVRTAAAASGLMALAVLLIGISPWTSVVVIAIGLSGLFSGVVIPATASMIGLETPHDAQSTVFGFNASSVAFGFFLGPLIGGGVAAATSDVSVSLYVIAALAVLLAVFVGTSAREPAR
ncbi:MAG: multidrug efflux MFS transporter [Chloroflexi bacterium]|nr:MAG: multidrug efflux MFS transporter [Chloroflexota bacterium]